MTDDGEETTDHRIDEVFALVMTLDGRRPAAELPRRLDALFRDLVRAEPVRPADETLDLAQQVLVVPAQRGLALIDSLRAIFSPPSEPSPQGADTDTASEASSDKDEALFVG